MRRFLALLACIACALTITCPRIDAAGSKPPTQPPTVINLSVVSANRAAAVVHAIYPSAHLRVDPQANALIVVASPETVTGIRTIVQGIDVKNPTEATVDTAQVHTVSPSDVIARLHPLFPHATLSAASNKTIIISAMPQDMTEIKAVIASMDTPLVTPSPRPNYAPDAVRIMQSDPRGVAKTVASSVRDVRVSVSGNNVLLSGAPDDVAHAKALIAQLDQPQPGVQFTEVYRLRYVDADSVDDLLKRSFPNISLQVDHDLNAITIFATAPVQQRIADAIAQLDVGASAPSAGGVTATGADSNTEVVRLKAAIPGLNGSPSTSAQDIASTVTQALSGTAPDLKITVPPNSTRLVLTGSQYSIKEAKDLIAQLDTPDPLVALDTEVLEVDEGAQKQLGLKFPTAALTTTLSETTPPPNFDGTQPPFMQLQKITRTPMSLSAELDFLIESNQARVLEDPRLTTFSGHTASLRAGETVNILTTTGGGTGTVATTQVQSFQTGVTLDITPVVNDGDYVTITLHPSVNTEAGISAAGVPNIQTRDTTTTVGLHDGETIVIGGLIEEDDEHDVQKIPILGNLPIIGKLFQDNGVTHTRNELIVTVTPHIIRPGGSAANLNDPPPIMAMPTPDPLPTLPPGTTLPKATARRMPVPIQVSTPSVAAKLATPQPMAVATVAAATAAPNALPTAFGQTNTYTYGAAPQNNYADDTQPPQIFFVQVQPTVVKPGQSITISAITSTNVSALSFGMGAMAIQTPIAKVGPGQWSATFPFSAAGITRNGNIQMSLTATGRTGTNVSLPIPISLIGP